MLYIIEGLDGTGKTTYIKQIKKNAKVIKLPSHILGKKFYHNFKKGKYKDYEYTHLLLAEHLIVLYEVLYNNKKNFIFDRSFISFFVYQEEEIKKYNLDKMWFDFIKLLKDIKNVKIFYFNKLYIDKKDDWLERKDKNLIDKRFKKYLQKIPKEFLDIETYNKIYKEN